jgi:hypothetical protein
MNLFDPSLIMPLQIRYSKRKCRGLAGAFLDMLDEWISMDGFMGCYGWEVCDHRNVFKCNLLYYRAILQPDIWRNMNQV